MFLFPQATHHLQLLNSYNCDFDKPQMIMAYHNLPVNKYFHIKTKSDLINIPIVGIFACRMNENGLEHSISKLLV